MSPPHPKSQSPSPKEKRRKKRHNEEKVTDVSKKAHTANEYTSDKEEKLEVEEQTSIVPTITRYLVIKVKNEADNPGGLKKISPFIIQRQLTYVAGELHNVKKHSKWHLISGDIY